MPQSPNASQQQQPTNPSRAEALSQPFSSFVAGGAEPGPSEGTHDTGGTHNPTDPATPATVNPGVEGDQPPPQPEVTPPEPVTWADLEVPAEANVPEEIQTSFLDLINNPDLSPKDRAKQMLGLQQQLAQQSAAAMEAQWTETQEAWRNEVRSMPEFSGAKLEPALGGIALLINRYGGADADKVRAGFDLTGAGNYPHILRFLHRIAADLNEERPVSGLPTSQEGRSQAAIMYPNQLPRQ